MKAAIRPIVYMDRGYWRVPERYFELQFDALTVAILSLEPPQGYCPLDQALADAYERSTNEPDNA